MSSTAIARQSDLTITDHQLDLIKKTIAQGATNQELELFLYDCKRRGVHPLDRLIHFTKRGGKYTPITSIDFMRSRAAETEDYAGNDDAVFKGEPKSESFEASTTVYRIVKGLRCAFTATARWSEYCPKENNFMWLRMPHTMLAKCSEALALRKGFPQQLAGLYASEEMQQATTEAAEVIEAEHVQALPSEAPLTQEQVTEIGELWKVLLDLKVYTNKEEIQADLKQNFGVKGRTDLSSSQAATLIANLRSMKRKAEESMGDEIF